MAMYPDAARMVGGFQGAEANMEFDRSRVAERIHRATNGSDERAADKERVFSGQASRRWIGYGAITALACVITLIGIKYLPFNQSIPQTKTFATSVGQVAKLQLADGSAVTLGPGSSIEYSGEFGKRDRFIRLTGQALFTVLHHSDKPFTVLTHNTQTRVLGTTFAIRSYPNDISEQVVVAEGRVEVNDKSVLGVGEAIRVTREGSITVQRNANISVLIGWTQGRLAFEQERFIDVIPALEQWYGIRIHVVDADINSVPVTVSFRDRSVANLIGVLSDVLEARIERRDNTIQLYKRKS